MGGPSTADRDHAGVVLRRVRSLHLVVDVLSLNEGVVGSESRRMKTVTQQERHRHGVGQPARMVQEKYLQKTNEVLHAANLCAVDRQ